MMDNLQDDTFLYDARSMVANSLNQSTVNHKGFFIEYL